MNDFVISENAYREYFRATDIRPTYDEPNRVHHVLPTGHIRVVTVEAGDIQDLVNAQSLEVQDVLTAMYSMQEQVGYAVRKSSLIGTYEIRSAAMLPSVGAFEEFEAARIDDRRFRRTIQELQRNVNIVERHTIAARLEELSELYIEDYGQSLDVESLRGLTRFLSKYSQLRRPSLSASPDGMLMAEWRDVDKLHYLAANFLPTQEIRYLAIRPSVAQEHLSIRNSGVVTIDEVFTELAAHNVQEWAKRE